MKLLEYKTDRLEEEDIMFKKPDPLRNIREWTAANWHMVTQALDDELEERMSKQEWADELEQEEKLMRTSFNLQVLNVVADKEMN